MKKKYLAIIPARGGSKRLPGKNLMVIGGDSLVGHAIKSVCSLEEISLICVTTDDQDIKNEAIKYGPYIHFDRPSHLADDEVKTFDVVKHAIQWFKNRGEKFDTVIVLQPTSPLRSKLHVREAIQLYEKKRAHAVVSVCKVEHPLEWCSRLGVDGTMEGFGRNLKSTERSQNCNEAYRLNGAIYVYDLNMLINKGGFFYDEKTYAYQMNNFDSIDIDSSNDFFIARCLFDYKNFEIC